MRLARTTGLPAQPRNIVGSNTSSIDGPRSGCLDALSRGRFGRTRSDASDVDSPEGVMVLIHVVGHGPPHSGGPAHTYFIQHRAADLTRAAIGMHVRATHSTGGTCAAADGLGGHRGELRIRQEAGASTPDAPDCANPAHRVRTTGAWRSTMLQRVMIICAGITGLSAVSPWGPDARAYDGLCPCNRVLAHGVEPFLSFARHAPCDPGLFEACRVNSGWAAPPGRTRRCVDLPRPGCIVQGSPHGGCGETHSWTGREGRFGCPGPVTDAGTLHPQWHVTRPSSERTVVCAKISLADELGCHGFFTPSRSALTHTSIMNKTTDMSLAYTINNFDNVQDHMLFDFHTLHTCHSLRFTQEHFQHFASSLLAVAPVFRV